MNYQIVHEPVVRKSQSGVEYTNYKPVKMAVVDKHKIVRIDTDSNGDETATLEDEHGQLEHVLVKHLPKGMREAYTGEVFNRYKE